MFENNPDLIGFVALTNSLKRSKALGAIGALKVEKSEKRHRGIGAAKDGIIGIDRQIKFGLSGCRRAWRGSRDWGRENRFFFLLGRGGRFILRTGTTENK